MKKPKIKWRSFYGTSEWSIKKVLECRIVGIGLGRMIYEFPAEPSEAAYLYAAMTMEKPGEEKDPPLDQGYFWNGSQHYDNVSWIIIDVVNDRWSYMQNGKVVNFPPRYRYTREHRAQIYEAAGSFVDALLNELEA